MSNNSAISRHILSESNVRVVARTLLLGLLLLVLALYLPAYAWAFIGDDYVQFGYIRELVEVPGSFYRAFNPFWSTWYYRPLQNLWLLGNRLLFGLNPFPYYYLQGLWHLLATALFYALARRLHLSRWMALSATALFALNNHHQDVIGWISSVATPMVAVFSLGAILAYLSARQKAVGRAPRRAKRRLVIVVLFTVLALLSHESGILLPPFLLLLALTGRRRAREYWLLSGLLLLALALGVVHLSRPNLTLAVQDTPVGAYFEPARLAQFLAVVAGRWTLLTKTAWGTALLNDVLGGPGRLLLVAAVLAGAAWVAYEIVHAANVAHDAILRRGQVGNMSYRASAGEDVARDAVLRRGQVGNMSYRAGTGKNVAHDAILRRGQVGNLSYTLVLAWIGLQLAFVYAALWVQAPQLLGGRHLYTAWAGVALALGLAAQGGLTWWQERARRQRPRKRETGRRIIVPAAVLASCLFAFLLAQITFTREAEASWLAHAREVGAVEAQLKERLPALTPETAIYARTFVITPAFAPYAAAVWYGETSVAGGSLARLQAAGTLGPESYLFDYEAGQLRELLPALHDYAASFLLWPEAPVASVAGPAGAERLALAVAGEGWQTVAVTTTVPAGTGFFTAFYGPPGSRYRVRGAAEGNSRILAAGTVSVGACGWQALTLALPHYWNKDTTFFLEAAPAGGGSAAWALPRLVQE